MEQFVLPKWVVYGLVIWGAFNAVCRLIPDATWEKLPPWLTAAIRLLRKAGPDGVGAYKQGEALVDNLVKAAKDSFRGPPPAAGLLLAFVMGCGAAGKVEHPRHIARGAVLGVAYGVQLADHECYLKAKELASEAVDAAPEPPPVGALNDLPVQSLTRVSFLERPHFAFASTAKDGLSKAIALAEKCDGGYQVARAGLLAASSAVDAWDSADRGDVGCGVVQGVYGLRSIADACKAVGVKMPPAVDDAFAAGDYVVGIAGAACKR